MTITPEQFNKIVLKEDLEEFVTKKEIKELKEELLTVMDTIVKKLDKMDHSSVSNQVAHDRFEHRITKLETTR